MKVLPADVIAKAGRALRTTDGELAAPPAPPATPPDPLPGLIAGLNASITALQATIRSLHAPQISVERYDDAGMQQLLKQVCEQNEAIIACLHAIEAAAAPKPATEWAFDVQYDSLGYITHVSAKPT